MADRMMLHMMMSLKEFADVEFFRQSKGIRTKRAAVCELIALGLRAVAEHQTVGETARWAGTGNVTREPTRAALVGTLEQGRHVAPGHSVASSRRQRSSSPNV